MASENLYLLSWPTSGLIEIQPEERTCCMALPTGGPCGEVFETHHALVQHAYEHMKSPHLKMAVIGKTIKPVDTLDRGPTRKETPPPPTRRRRTSDLSSPPESGPAGVEDQLHQESSEASGVANLASPTAGEPLVHSPIHPRVLSAADQKDLQLLKELFKMENKKVDQEAKVIIRQLKQTDAYLDMNKAQRAELEAHIESEAGIVLNNFIWLIKHERRIDVDLPATPSPSRSRAGTPSDSDDASDPYEYSPGFHPAGDTFFDLSLMAPHFRNFARGINKRKAALDAAVDDDNIDSSQEPTSTFSQQPSQSSLAFATSQASNDNALYEDKDRKDLFQLPPQMNAIEIRRILDLNGTTKKSYIWRGLRNSTKGDMKKHGVYHIKDAWQRHLAMMEVVRSVVDLANYQENWVIIDDKRDRERVAYAICMLDLEESLRKKPGLALAPAGKAAVAGVRKSDSHKKNHLEESVGGGANNGDDAGLGEDEEGDGHTGQEADADATNGGGRRTSKRTVIKTTRQNIRQSLGDGKHYRDEDDDVASTQDHQPVKKKPKSTATVAKTVTKTPNKPPTNGHGKRDSAGLPASEPAARRHISITSQQSTPFNPPLAPANNTVPNTFRHSHTPSSSVSHNGKASNSISQMRDGMEIKRLELETDGKVCELLEKLEEYKNKHGTAFPSSYA